METSAPPDLKRGMAFLACCSGTNSRLRKNPFGLGGHVLLPGNEESVEQLKVSAEVPEDLFEEDQPSPQGDDDREPHRGLLLVLLYCCSSFCVASLFGLLAFLAPSSAVGRLVCGVPSLDASLGAAVAEKYFPSYPYVGWWSMPVPQPQILLSSLHDKLEPYNLEGLAARSNEQCHEGAEVPCSFPKAELTWVSGSARSIASAMFMATAIKGVMAKVPEKLRGVFWVRGGDGSVGLEELAVLQYGRWFPEERVFIVPQAPFTRAWPAGVPVGADPGSEKYDDLDRTKREARLARYAHSVAYGFRTKSLAHADVQPHQSFGDVRRPLELQGAWGSGALTLEESPESRNGTVWRCGCYSGWNGCNPLDGGSHEMVKIISGDGNFLQPHYNDFLAYMGSAALFVHSGWKTEHGREDWAKWYYSATGGKPPPEV